jgi:hypothetical protein
MFSTINICHPFAKGIYKNGCISWNHNALKSWVQIVDHLYTCIVVFIDALHYMWAKP